MKAVLLSTYDLGHQSLGLASLAAWLRRDGHDVVCADLSVESIPRDAVREAALVAVYLPMHTATRLAAKAIGAVRSLNPAAHLCCYGLYAPLNECYLRGLGVESVIGGEFEGAVAALAARLAQGLPPLAIEPIVLDRLAFLPADRSGLPPLARYASLRIDGERRVAGYTEASRGCKHLCRHCPIVPVYQGKFRVVPVDVVMADIRQQAAAGARHITFGDPDFLNGPAHAERVIRALDAEFPDLTYDVTVKIEHLKQHPRFLPLLASTGCLFVTSAVESLEDAVLERLAKGHTRADFIDAARACRAEGLPLAPTFIPFTPWTTLAGYRDLLDTIATLDIVENVAPVQLALRLLVTAGSPLLNVDGIRDRVGPFDAAALLYPWKHEDPEIDALAAGLLHAVWDEQRAGASRRRIFERIWRTAHDRPLPENFDLIPRAAIPYLDEPWYC